MTVERDRLTLARAERARLKAAILDGELVTREHASSAWWNAVHYSRRRFEALPDALAERLGLDDANVRAALNVELTALTAVLFDGADDD